MTTRATHLLLCSVALSAILILGGCQSLRETPPTTPAVTPTPAQATPRCFGCAIWKVRRTEESATHRQLRLYFLTNHFRYSTLRKDREATHLPA
jgi:hypothetical protein